MVPWIDELLDAWGAWARTEHGPQGYVSVLGDALRHGAGRSHDEAQCLDVDRAIASLPDELLLCISLKYLRRFTDVRAAHLCACSERTYQSRIVAAQHHLEGFFLALGTSSAKAQPALDRGAHSL